MYRSGALSPAAGSGYTHTAAVIDTAKGWGRRVGSAAGRGGGETHSSSPTLKHGGKTDIDCNSNITPPDPIDPPSTPPLRRRLDTEMHTETRNKKPVALDGSRCPISILREFLIYEQLPGFGLLAVNRNEPLIAELLGDYFTPVHAPLSQPVIRKPPNDNAGSSYLQCCFKAVNAGRKRAECRLLERHHLS
ncbi:unnamed protein product [Leuciscus chuanchicus]